MRKRYILLTGGALGETPSKRESEQVKKIYIPLVSARLGLRLALLALAAALTVAMAASPALAQLSQDTEQEGESGEADQSFTATQEGDNSNQCVGEQGVINTGNSQNVISIEQYKGKVDDFEFEEVGSSIEVSPTNTTECDQEVNQAASASSTDTGYCVWYGWWCWWSADGYYWYWDGYYWWGPYATWTAAASETAMGTLGATGSLATLAALATLGLVGTSLLIRRSRGA